MMAGVEDDRLGDVTESAPFVRRHIGPNESEAKAMLDVLGFASVEELVDAAAPAVIRHPRDFDLEPPLGEPATLARLAGLAGRNRVMTSLIGMGYHGTHTPEVIRRNVLENPSWYTAYTPYQSEVSQGRMEALLNYQQMIIDLTGMELANASLLDEATAAAEAMAMARRVGKSKSSRFLVDADCHPQTIDVIRTRAAPLDLEVEVRAAADLDGPCFGMLVQYPGSGGRDTGSREGGGTGTRARGAGRGCGRSARPRDAALAGRARGGHRGREQPAVRGSHGLRRSPCRVLCYPRRVPGVPPRGALSGCQ